MAAAAKADFCAGCPVGGSFNKADRTCSVPDPDDGLPLTCVGPWAEEKHRRLKKYVDISRAPRRKFLGQGGATYIDPFCGPGRSRIRQTPRIVDGGALMAVREAAGSNTPFSEVYIGDLNAAFADACGVRLGKLGVRASVCAGSASATTPEIVGRAPRFALHFAFLDPYDLTSLPMTVIAALAALRRIDLLIHVSIQDLNRNLARYIAARESPLDAFVPGWRGVLVKGEREEESRRRIRIAWSAHLRDLGLESAEGIELVTGSKDQPLYWLAFAARNPLALQFWEQIRNVSPQRELGF